MISPADRSGVYRWSPESIQVDPTIPNSQTTIIPDKPDGADRVCRVYRGSIEGLTRVYME